MNASTERYDLVLGSPDGQPGESSLLVGYSFTNEHDDFYTLRLFMFPRQLYFMRKNATSDLKYTIFSKAIANRDGKIALQNPVGFAKLDPDNKYYLKVRFCLIPEARILMHLNPTYFGGSS